MLQRGEVQGYNFNRMAVEFTMVNQGKVVPCSISTARWTISKVGVTEVRSAHTSVYAVARNN
jgi:hypothetical protein